MERIGRHGRGFEDYVPELFFRSAGVEVFPLVRFPVSGLGALHNAAINARAPWSGLAELATAIAAFACGWRPTPGVCKSGPAAVAGGRGNEGTADLIGRGWFGAERPGV